MLSSSSSSSSCFHWEISKLGLLGQSSGTAWKTKHDVCCSLRIGLKVVIVTMMVMMVVILMVAVMVTVMVTMVMMVMIILIPNLGFLNLNHSLAGPPLLGRSSVLLGALPPPTWRGRLWSPSPLSSTPECIIILIILIILIITLLIVARVIITNQKQSSWRNGTCMVFSAI